MAAEGGEDELHFVDVGGAGAGGGGGSGGAAVIGGGAGAVGGVGADSGGGGGGSNATGFIRESKHPVAAFFHVAFKIAALVVYMFSSSLSSNFIFVFVVCILLLACDFWAVKNVTGRLLVGLRWWNYVKEDGTNEWVYESLENMAEISQSDSRLFWGALYISPLIWFFFMIIALLKLELQWMLVVIVALVMNGANIYGYTKCSQDAKQRMQKLMQQGLAVGSMQALENSSIRNWVLDTVVGAATGSTGQNNNASGGGAGGGPGPDVEMQPVPVR